jgi:hypothetical protein
MRLDNSMGLNEFFDIISRPEVINRPHNALGRPDDINIVSESVKGVVVQEHDVVSVYFNVGFVNDVNTIVDVRDNGAFLIKITNVKSDGQDLVKKGDEPLRVGGNGIYAPYNPVMFLADSTFDEIIIHCPRKFDPRSVQIHYKEGLLRVGFSYSEEIYREPIELKLIKD